MVHLSAEQESSGTALISNQLDSWQTVVHSALQHPLEASKKGARGANPFSLSGFPAFRSYRRGGTNDKYFPERICRLTRSADLEDFIRAYGQNPTRAAFRLR